MKNLTFILLFFLIQIFFISCRNTENNDSADSLSVEESYSDLWKFDYDSAANDMVIETLKPFNKDTLQVSTIVNFLNNYYPEVNLEYIKTSNDTVFTKVVNSIFLTEQMGSAGADFYLKSATNLFTDLKNINYVCFDFEEGDHAVPGVYKRQDW